MRHLAAVLMASVVLVGCDETSAPPVLTAVPAFELVDQDGEAFSSDALEGQLWVANTIFTTCPSVCPMLTSQMRNLQGRFEGQEGLQFLSFSVDPTNDRPEALRRYAENHDADLRSWHFLTGTPEAMEAAIVQGLRMNMGTRQSSGDINHGTHFVLVDRRGRIRGFYRSDRAGLEELEGHIRHLLDES